MVRWIRVVTAAALIAGAVAFWSNTSPAATPASGTLSEPGDTLRWSGSFASSDDDNDVFRLTLALPRNVWHRAGGVQIGIRFPYNPPDNDLDLYVYRADAPEDPIFGREAVARSAGGDEDVESVTLPFAGNGEYIIEVVPYSVPEGGMSYEGIVQVEYDVKETPVRDLLPNLTSLPQRNVRIEPRFNAIGGSCGRGEYLEDGARRCLRFDQIIGNVGDGPMELRYEIEGLATSQRLNQRIYRSDGTFYDRQADTYEFHATHAHFHYKNFAQSHLYASNEAGTKGELVRSGTKNGFCLIDVENTWFGRKGDASKRYTSCLPKDEEKESPSEEVPLGTQVNGISVGWADVYNWNLPDQYIEISGVADGYYLLETVADSPTNTLIESSEADNAGTVLIWICGESANLANAAAKPC